MIKRQLVLALLFAAHASAAEPSFFRGLSGTWEGSGDAYVATYGDISATCKVAVNSKTAAVTMDGTCGILFFRQPLGLTIKSDGANRFVGTYTGSKTGPARLTGKLTGNRLVMSIRWGGVVNGDRDAQMVLQRTGPNSFQQIVNDKVDGKTRRTSDFAFVRR